MHRPSTSPLLALLAAALFLAACREEPSFDERYDAAEARIQQTAEEIDRELAAGRPTPGSTPPTPAPQPSPPARR